MPELVDESGQAADGEGATAESKDLELELVARTVVVDEEVVAIDDVLPEAMAKRPAPQAEAPIRADAGFVIDDLRDAVGIFAAKGVGDAFDIGETRRGFVALLGISGAVGTDDQFLGHGDC